MDVYPHHELHFYKKEKDKKGSVDLEARTKLAEIMLKVLWAGHSFWYRYRKLGAEVWTDSEKSFAEISLINATLQTTSAQRVGVEVVALLPVIGKLIC